MRPPPPYPLPAHRALEPPGGAGARPDWGQRKPAGRVITIKGKRGLEAAPRLAAGSQASAPLHRAPAPPRPKSTTRRTLSSHTRGSRRREKEVRAGALAPRRPHPFRPAAPPSLPEPNAHTHAHWCPQPPPGPTAPPRPPTLPPRHLAAPLPRRPAGGASRPLGQRRAVPTETFWERAPSAAPAPSEERMSPLPAAGRLSTGPGSRAACPEEARAQSISGPAGAGPYLVAV